MAALTSTKLWTVERKASSICACFSRSKNFKLGTQQRKKARQSANLAVEAEYSWILLTRAVDSQGRGAKWRNALRRRTIRTWGTPLCHISRGLCLPNVFSNPDRHIPSEESRRTEIDPSFSVSLPIYAWGCVYRHHRRKKMRSATITRNFQLLDRKKTNILDWALMGLNFLLL